MVVPSPMTSDTTKQTLRQHLRLVRDAYVRSLAPPERSRQEAAAVDSLLGVLGDGAWASYLAMGSEIDPAGLAHHRPQGTPLAYPWFADRQSPMLFRPGIGAFERGPFGIRQPGAGQPELLPDWIVVPLVGVDPGGNRIGQGAGHYDRALTAIRSSKKVTAIGLAWDVQLIDRVSVDPWDQPLDLIVTPSRTIEVQA